MLASNATDLQALRIRGQVAGGEVEQLRVPVFPAQRVPDILEQKREDECRILN